MSIKLQAEKRVAGKYNAEDMQPHDTISAIFSKGSGKECKYLMLSHVKCKMLTFPIGKVKHDQGIVEALKEECEEEVGLKVTQFQEILQFKKNYDREKKSVEVKTHVFQIIKYTGEPKNCEPKKHYWMRWMTRKEIEDIKMHLSDPVIYYFKWLDEINTPSLAKPHVTVGSGK